MLEYNSLRALLIAFDYDPFGTGFIPAESLFNKRRGRRKQFRDERWSGLLNLFPARFWFPLLLQHSSWRFVFFLHRHVAAPSARAARTLTSIHASLLLLRLRGFFGRAFFRFALRLRTNRGFPSAADLDRALCARILQNHARLFQLQNLIIAHRHEKRFRTLRRAEEKGVAKRHDFYRIDKIIFLCPA